MKKVFYLALGLLITVGCASKKGYMSSANIYQPVPSEHKQAKAQDGERDVREDYMEDSGDIVLHTEKVTVTEGRSMQKYAVIVGSFAIKENARKLRKTLENRGFFNTSIMRNEAGMYRVCAESFDNEREARESLLNIRNRYSEFQDAWLLYAK